VLVKTNYYVS